MRSFSIVFLLMLVLPVSAATYPLNPPYRLDHQGQTVYINDTIDISGYGWGIGVAWYGRYGEYNLPQYVRPLTGTKKDVFKFWLDPSIFSGRGGMWYQFYDNTTENHGNLELFYLMEGYRNKSTTYPNGTTNYENLSISNVTVPVKIPDFILSDIHVTDYLLSKNDSLNTKFEKIWLFGRVNGLYNVSGNLSIKQVNLLEPGSYKLTSHKAGKNTIFEVGYDNTTETLTTPWRAIGLVSIAGIQPRLVLPRFESMINKTDDIIYTYDLEVQEPSLTVNRMDEIAVSDYIPIAFGIDTTVLDVRGYTNAKVGTKISAIIDPDKQTVRTINDNTYTTIAEGSDMGGMRYYRVYLPLIKKEMPNGIHTLKVTSTTGGIVYADFPISELPADSYVPNATLKYIGDRNPWIPTPTPITITNVVEKTVVVKETIVVKVNVTPSQESVNAAVSDFWTKIVTEVLIGAGILIVVGYVVSIIYRGRKR